MIAIAATLLSSAAQAFLDAVAGTISDDLARRLKADPAVVAYKVALATAIQRYSTPERLTLARALTGERSILMSREVAGELSQILRFDREPNYDLIGRSWMDELDDPPRWRDFSDEARLLTHYLRQELQASDVYRPVFEAKSLEAVAVQTAAAAVSLVAIEAGLGRLLGLMDTRLGELSGAIARATAGIRNQIRDDSLLIEEKTRGFVGREAVFAAIDRFIAGHPRGYLVVRGEPGIGKSAIAAQLIKSNGYVYHFNNRAQSVGTPRAFLRNICAQLIAVYDLPVAVLPPEADQDSGFLVHLLTQVRAKSRQRCVIVIDALDEVDTTGSPPGANVLYLPPILPEGVFVVAFSRPVTLPLRLDCEHATLDLNPQSPENMQDVRDLIAAACTQPGVQTYLNAHSLSPAEFTDRLGHKSQGNFMYLRLVLADIEQGRYADRDLTTFPTGLTNYYDDHWRRIRGSDEDAWFAYKLPVLTVLAAAHEPISIAQIAAFAQISQRGRVRAVLDEWRAFIHEQQVVAGEVAEWRYRLYHLSFIEFIAGKEEIKDERVNLRLTHQQIARTLLDDLELG